MKYRRNCFSKFLYVFAVILFSVSNVSANDPSIPIKFDANGHWYSSFNSYDGDTCHTWTEARDYAAEQTYEDPDTGVLLIGHLVTIQDQAEQEYVASHFSGGAFDQIWLGAFRYSHVGPELADNWVWVTGEEWSYTNWDTNNNQPNSYDEDYARLLSFFGWKWHDFPDVASSCSVLYTIVEYEPLIYSCSGFEPPMDNLVTVKKKNRVLPLKMTLDFRSAEVSDIDITAAPVVEIDFTAGNPTTPPGEELLSAGKGDEGNQFVYTGSKWGFNLQSKNFSGKGTYTITVVSGDPDEYSIAPTCRTTFIIQ